MILLCSHTQYKSTFDLILFSYLLHSIPLPPPFPCYFRFDPDSLQAQGLQVSPFRIVRIVNREGDIQSIRNKQTFKLANRTFQ